MSHFSPTQFSESIPSLEGVASHLGQLRQSEGKEKDNKTKSSGRGFTRFLNARLSRSITRCHPSITFSESIFLPKPLPGTLSGHPPSLEYYLITPPRYRLVDFDFFSSYFALPEGLHFIAAYFLNYSSVPSVVVLYLHKACVLF